MSSRMIPMAIANGANIQWFLRRGSACPQSSQISANQRERERAPICRPPKSLPHSGKVLLAVRGLELWLPARVAESLKLKIDCVVLARNQAVRAAEKMKRPARISHTAVSPIFSLLTQCDPRTNDKKQQRQMPEGSQDENKSFVTSQCSAQLHRPICRRQTRSSSEAIIRTQPRDMVGSRGWIAKPFFGGERLFASLTGSFCTTATLPLI
eukprot:scaffold2043_cov166-Amphora_coffeaeformis.AAC.13